MPRMPNSVHDCGNCEVTIGGFDGNHACRPYSFISIKQSGETSGSVYDPVGFSMFFGSLDEIRDFHAQIGRELEKYDAKKSEAVA
jgi:hypothetical protein